MHVVIGHAICCCCRGHGQSISGLIQSTGWPANVAVMGNWFGKKKRGAVMGLWSGTISFGNILGTGIVAATLAIMGDSLGWRWAMVFSGIWVVFFAVWVFLQLTPHPTDLGLPDPNKELDSLLDNEESKQRLLNVSCGCCTLACALLTADPHNVCSAARFA